MGSRQLRDLLHLSYREVRSQADISGNQQPFEKVVYMQKKAIVVVKNYVYYFNTRLMYSIAQRWSKVK